MRETTSVWHANFPTDAFGELVVESRKRPINPTPNHVCSSDPSGHANSALDSM
jgi:hypothetical protein